MTSATLETTSGEILLAGDVWINNERPGLATFYPYGDQVLAPGIRPGDLHIDGQQPRRIVFSRACRSSVLHYHLAYDFRD